MPTTFTKETKPNTQYVKDTQNSYLLKEDTFFLLLESGDKIILTRGSVVGTVYTKETKP